MHCACNGLSFAVRTCLLQWKIISKKRHGIQSSRNARQLKVLVSVDRSQPEDLSDNHERMCSSTTISDPFAVSKI